MKISSSSTAGLVKAETPRSMSGSPALASSGFVFVLNVGVKGEGENNANCALSFIITALHHETAS